MALLGSFSFYIENARSIGSVENKKLLKSYIDEIEYQSFSFRLLWKTRNIALHQGFVINPPSYKSLPESKTGNYKFYVSKKIYLDNKRNYIDNRLKQEILKLSDEQIEIGPLLHDLIQYINKIQGFILFLKENILNKAISIVNEVLGPFKTDNNELLLATEIIDNPQIKSVIVPMLASQNTVLINNLINNNRIEYQNYIKSENYTL